MRQPPNEPTEPSETGDQEIDQALAELAGLHDTPVSTHGDRLARVHETLQHTLDRPEPPAQTD